jgi:hypothetical protein
MSFDWYEFGKEIFLVSIPVGIGVGTSKWITNSWQKRKEQNEIKMKIISYFMESFGRKYTLLGEFTSLLISKYVDYSLTTINPDGSPKFIHVFPTEDDKKPSKKYVQQWDDFKNTFWKLSYPTNEFMSNFRLYYTENELNNKIVKVNEDMNAIFHIAEIFFYSNDLNEFQTRYKETQAKLDIILILLIEIESELIKKDIKIR